VFFFLLQHDILFSFVINSRSSHFQFLDIYAGYGNYWTTLPAWPSTTRFRLYLAQNGGLVTTAPTAASSLSYSFDPKNPTPTIGGNNLFLQCGPLGMTLSLAGCFITCLFILQFLFQCSSFLMFRSISS
jgi:predicted acyl esterase